MEHNLTKDWSLTLMNFQSLYYLQRPWLQGFTYAHRVWSPSTSKTTTEPAQRSSSDRVFGAPVRYCPRGVMGFAWSSAGRLGVRMDGTWWKRKWPKVRESVGIWREVEFGNHWVLLFWEVLVCVPEILMNTGKLWPSWRRSVPRWVLFTGFYFSFFDLINVCLCSIIVIWLVWVRVCFLLLLQWITYQFGCWENPRKDSWLRFWILKLSVIGVRDKWKWFF